MNSINTTLFVSLMLAILFSVGAAKSTIQKDVPVGPFGSIRWSYIDAQSGNPVQGTATIDPQDQNAMKKSILVVKMASAIAQALADYHATCDLEVGEARAKIANALETKLLAFEREIANLEGQRANELAKLNRSIEYMRKLAKLVKEVRRHKWSYESMPVMRATMMRITTGGAQDAQKFRDQIDRGIVPDVADYQAYGFINEFDLYVEGKACDSLLCMAPVVGLDADAKKMYLQVNLGTNVQVDKFVRKPLNVGIALDLSGSMGANDQTVKSRLDWAKDAVNETLNNLVDGQDYFTLVYFSDHAKVLWSPIDNLTKKPRPIKASDKAEIRAIVTKLEIIGSTNLRAGLDLAYQELAKVKALFGKGSAYENRVIMITDANLNTGDTDESSAVIEVEKQSRTRGINLTTIGIGDNFFADFVNKISILRGSNYIFAQDGKRMLDYFQQFATLVTPVAYDFVADVDIDGAKAKLVRVHGVPEVKAQAANSIVNISTLFFASPKDKGGGAQVLEFDLL